MHTKTLEEIDFYRIRDEVAKYCATEEGLQSFLKRQPLTKVQDIELLKDTSREWTAYISKTQHSPINRWEPIHQLIPIIKTNGAALSLEQVAALGQFVVAVKSVKEGILQHQIDLNLKLLPQQVELLEDYTSAEKKIFRIITPTGELRDLPEITAIRKQIASLNARIKNIMQSFTSNQKLAGVLESTVPVLRNGRQVLAVKSNQQNRIPGIIHEVSQSSQTVYIEPEEAVRCSNELIQKENELIQVIKQILTDLTFSLQPEIPFFKKSLPVMLHLDTTLAAARWGLEHNCNFALPCSKDRPPALLQARHPILGEKAVPIDVRFHPGKRVLIITGPNTGGKTVTLKTFALFAMLNQAGIPLPAAEGTDLPIFTNVFADIGDSQNMDMNLSTFSGHMKNIAEAVKHANESSLVLLDELGSGTDPQEGTAIAMSVLDTLIQKKAFVLVTTHMGILKNYGYTKPECINASVEFNADTLSPSYHLLMGVPGESHALDIAQRSGLPIENVKNAKKYIATEQADISSLIKGLNKKHVELDKLQRQISGKEADLQERLLRQKEKELSLRKKENELKKGHQQEMHDFLIHSRRLLENLVREIKEGELTREKTTGVKKFISELEENTQRMDDKIELEEEKLAKVQAEFEKEIQAKKSHTSSKKTKKKLSNAEALKLATPVNTPSVEKVAKAQANVPSFQPGALVIAGKTQTEGVLISEERKGIWSVQFGSVKMTVKQKDLQLVTKKQETSLSPSISIDLVGDRSDERPVFELRLLGMHAEEAIKALERQIDLCALHNFPHFSVIHGKGNGILQQAVQDYLSHNPLIKDFSFAPAEDGGFGKTYVTLNDI